MLENCKSGSMRGSWKRAALAEARQFSTLRQPPT